MDVEKITKGRFRSRVTDEGRPTSFIQDDASFTIVRERGASQRIDCSMGLGAVALCRTDGEVLGYGSLDISEIGLLADMLDAELGSLSGQPLERMSGHGLHLVVPLDAITAEMPQEVVKGFLDGRIDPDFLWTVAISDEMVADLVEQDAHGHRHAPGESCDQCAPDESDVDRIREQIDQIVTRNGHAVVLIMPEGEDPGYVYTVGLGDAGWPEIVLTGLCSDQGRLIVNRAVEWLRARDMKPSDGLVLPDAVNIPLRFQAVDRADAYRFARVAAERHVRERRAPLDFRIIQIMWPDRNGAFPNEDEYDGRDLPEQVEL